ncbi:LacI family DNA-binding transcriptional regulator [Lactobacillus psittaci]|uniref:Sucrose operon repressor n=1 Tax=Lactobacillus psittaci DSM 15354 TaxID=1122152 RepID=A0A0R1S429_9LACO|nr:LacI family DNA-binding transcriptional regulator [Lactobacillus psittaci]KRL64006.1 sucrose operon repressor [Lactobacillus psittaci DSM 15354]
MPVKLTDVAKLANVSPTTVSRVINNYGYISEKTRKKVFDAMNKLNYQPNSLARSLQGKKTQLVGAIVPSLTNPFFAELVSRIEEILNQKNYKLILCNAAQDSSQKERAYLNMLKANQVDGIISGTHNLDITQYQEAGLPIVSFDRNLCPDVPVVSSDNYQGGWIATSNLINSGCEKIAFFGNIKGSNNPTDLRLKGYQDAIKSHDLNQILVPMNFFESANLKKMTFQKLLTSHRIDGAFFTDDLSANLFWQYIRLNHFQNCNQIKIVGYDGTSIMRQLNPNLSTIIQPIDEIAKLLVDLLLKRINHEEISEMNYVLPVTFFKGDSI